LPVESIGLKAASVSFIISQAVRLTLGRLKASKRIDLTAHGNTKPVIVHVPFGCGSGFKSLL
jgi:hypothetical protein